MHLWQKLSHSILTVAQGAQVTRCGGAVHHGHLEVHRDRVNDLLSVLRPFANITLTVRTRMSMLRLEMTSSFTTRMHFGRSAAENSNEHALSASVR